MFCRHCLYEIALSSTDEWRLSWNPDNDAAPYECTENEAGHEPAADATGFVLWGARATEASPAEPRHHGAGRQVPSDRSGKATTADR
jgi:hypothetical protein